MFVDFRAEIYLVFRFSPGGSSAKKVFRYLSIFMAVLQES